MENIIKTKEFELINNTPSMAQLYPVNKNQEYTGFDNNYLMLDFGNKQKGDLVEMNMLFKSEKYTITSASATCGCTNPSVTTNPDGTQLVVVRFDSNKITNNVSKGVSLYLNNTSKVIKFNLVINK